jgi:predicted GNAT family acetyltransferase
MIADHPERHRYILDIDGREAAEIVYRMHGPGTIELEHTEVKKDFEGQGLASKIAAYALDDARRKNLRVIATCEYLQGWLRKHPDYSDLLSQA